MLKYKVNEFKYKEQERKPTVPKKDEKPIMGLKSSKNFIISNAVENILSGIFIISIFIWFSMLSL